jgi:uncharacterized RDD family membrane protein YckC
MTATEAEVEISLVKADAGIRFVSYILDVVFLAILRAVLIFVILILHMFLKYAGDVIQPIVFLLYVLIPVGYFTYFFGNGQTLGMMAMKIKLVRTDGEYPIGYTRGFLRFIGMIISALLIGLGFLWILIDKNNQGLHDYIADTYVVAGSSFVFKSRKRADS